MIFFSKNIHQQSFANINNDLRELVEIIFSLSLSLNVWWKTKESVSMYVVNEEHMAKVIKFILSYSIIN